MYSTNLTPKITVSCRLDGALREVLEEEAYALGKPLSAYIENLLLHRSQEDASELRKRIFLLEAENADLKQANPSTSDEPSMAADVSIRLLKHQNLKLQDQMRVLIAERKVWLKMREEIVPFGLTTNGYQSCLKRLQRIKEWYPNHDIEQILLSSLDLSVQNEDAFFLKTLKDVLRNSNSSLKKLAL
jgi:hypothetical protein